MRKILAGKLLCICLIMSFMLTLTVVVNAASNIKICGVDIGIAAGTHMQFTDANGNNSETGYFYKGTYLAATQCFGFARWVQIKLFGKSDYNGSYYSVSVNGSTSIAKGSLTTSNLKSFITASKPGAHLRTYKDDNDNAHSMIITEITDKGFSIAQANGSNNNEYSKWKQNYVGTYTYTWSSYVNSTYGKRGINYIKLPKEYPYSNKPSKPTIKLHENVTSTSVSLDWDAVSGAESYKLKWKRAGEDYNSGIDVSGSYKNVSGLESGKLYWFRLAAVNSYGTSDWSDTYGVYLIPNTPVVSENTRTSLKVSWSSTGGKTKYELLMKKSGGNYNTVAYLDNAYSYTVSGLTPGAQYYFKILEHNIEHPSVVSPKSEAGYGYTLLSAPSVSAVTSTSVLLTWNHDALNGDYTYKYRICRRISGTSYFTGIAEVSGKSYQDTGLTPDTAYDYYIDVLKSDGTWCINSMCTTTKTDECLVSEDFNAPIISNAYISDINKDGFTINCHIEDNLNTSGVWVNTLMPNNDWKNLWVPAYNGDFSYRINASDYAGTGVYEVSIWVFDNNENSSPYGYEPVTVTGDDAEPPTISDAYISDIDETGFTVNCDLQDNVNIGGVWVNTLMPNNNWKNIWVPSGKGIFSYRVNISEYAGQGTYEVSLWAFDYSENSSPYDFNAVNVVDSDFGYSNYIIRNGHVYAFCNEPILNWNGANLYSTQAGGHLVTISDEDENAFVYQEEAECSYFIGLNDIEEESNFVWVNGEPVNYTNWSDGEPNNENDSQDAVHIWQHSGQWYDTNADTTYPDVGFVTEFEPQIETEFEYNNNRYIVYSIAPTWDAAREYCKESGGHLVTISSLEENEAITNHLNNNKYYLSGATYVDEGAWKWITYEQFDFTSWETGEPSNNDGQKYLTILNGKWTAVGNTSHDYNMGFICEIESNEYNLSKLHVETTETSYNWYFDVTLDTYKEGAKVLVVLFDENDVLIDTQCQNQLEITNSFVLPKNEQARFYKVFIINDALNPLCKMYKGELK